MREIFLIADIGGYTNFMRGQSKALAHAQVVIGLLLEAIIEFSAPFTVEKLEGDAVFFSMDWLEEGTSPPLFAAVEAMHRAFILSQSKMEAARTCDCESCSQMHALRLKFTAHAGQAVRQNIGGFTELASLDVILVHRMLKNRVPVQEYLLGTDKVLTLLGGSPPAVRLDHNFPGIGLTRTYYRQLPAARPGHRQAPLLSKFVARIMLEFKSLLFHLGICSNFIIKYDKD